MRVSCLGMGFFSPLDRPAHSYAAAILALGVLCLAAMPARADDIAYDTAVLRGLDKVTTTTHAVYDPATDSWTDAAPLSKGRDHIGVVAAEGKIHVIGGRFISPVERTDMHEVYDPATNTMSTAAPLKTPRSAVAAAMAS